MSSILDAFRKEHDERSEGAIFAILSKEGWRLFDGERPSSAYAAAVDHLPNASTLAALAASILLGSFAGVGLARLVRGDSQLRQTGTHQIVSHTEAPEAKIAAKAPPPPVVASAATEPLAPVVASAPAAIRISPDPPSDKPVVLDGGMSVGVLDEEYVTATGEANSVHSLVAEICRQAGIDLRTYTAPDRSYAGHLEGEPLADALRRILRSESYLVGVRLDAHSAEKRMTWLHVLASNETPAGDPPAEAAPQSRSPRMSSD